MYWNCTWLSEGSETETTAARVSVIRMIGVCCSETVFCKSLVKETHFVVCGNISDELCLLSEEIAVKACH